MKRLDRALAKLAIKLHPDRVLAVADALREVQGELVLRIIEEHCRPMSTGKELINDLGESLQGASNISGEVVAAKLEAASAAATLVNADEDIELVWTGPTTGQVPIRRTAQVLEGLIDEAREVIFIVSFVAYKVPRLVSALQNAQKRGVYINVLLERSKSDGGSVDFDSIETIKEKLPNARFYVWDGKRALDKEFLLGKVHAKCAVADGQLAFVSSANLTQAAMEINMEMGLLVRGGATPRKIQEHLQLLVQSEVLEAL